MPDPIEPQLDELRRKARRRLIGAIVLALAAAVLVPMLLESDPKPLGEDVSVRIPPVDDVKFESKLAEKGKAPADKPGDAKPAAEPSRAETAAPMIVPIAPPAANKDAGAPPPPRSVAQAEQRVISPSTRPAAAEPAAAPATKPPSADSGKSAEPPKAPSAESGKSAEPPKAPSAESGKSAEPPKSAEPARTAGAYSVQLAAFTDDKGANSLAARLKKDGHPAYIEPYETSRGRVWRVRVGPYPSREAAEAARGKLKAEGHNGILAAAK